MCQVKAFLRDVQRMKSRFAKLESQNRECYPTATHPVAYHTSSATVKIVVIMRTIERKKSISFIWSKSWTWEGIVNADTIVKSMIIH